MKEVVTIWSRGQPSVKAQPKVTLEFLPWDWCSVNHNITTSYKTSPFNCDGTFAETADIGQNVTFIFQRQMASLVTRNKKGILNSFSLFWWLNCNRQMDSNTQKFLCSSWSFAEMKRCLSYLTCSYYFLDRSASCCIFQCISSCYIFLPVFRFHGRKEKYFLGNCHWSLWETWWLSGCSCPTQLWGAGLSIYEHGLIITSGLGLGLGLFFKKLPLPHGVMQLSVSTAYFLLPDKQLKVLSQTLFRAEGIILCCEQSQLKVGLMPVSYRNSRTSLSRSLAVVQREAFNSFCP